MLLSPISRADQQSLALGSVFAELQVRGRAAGARIAKLTHIIETLINAMYRRGAGQLHSLTAVSNNAGAAGKGGLSTLSQNGQINRLILSYLGNNKELEKKYLTGHIAIELCPQGTLAERLRAGGAGIPAFFTPTGVRMYRSPQTMFVADK